jgi:hypothetical protein
MIAPSRRNRHLNDTCFATLHDAEMKSHWERPIPMRFLGVATSEDMAQLTPDVFMKMKSNKAAGHPVNSMFLSGSTLQLLT